MDVGRCLLRAAAFCGILACSFLAKSSLPPDPGPDPVFSNAAWVGGTFGLGKVDQAQYKATLIKPNAGDVYAVSVDDVRAVVWMFNGSQVLVADFLGNILKTIPLAIPKNPITGLILPDVLVRDGTGEDAFCLANGLVPNTLPKNLLWPISSMATNSANGHTWLANADLLYEFSDDGVLLSSKNYGALITGLTTDPTRSRLWVSTCRDIRAYDEGGQVVARHPITDNAQLIFIKDVRYDVRSDRLWAVSRQRVLSLDPDGNTLLDVAIPGDGPLAILSNLAVTAEAEYAAGDGDNHVWIAAGGKLRYLDQSGASLLNMDVTKGLLPIPGLPVTPPNDIVALAASPRDHSAWAASRQHLINVSTEGEILRDISLRELSSAAGANSIGLPIALLQPILGAQSRIRVLALYDDLIPPQFSFPHPGQDAYIGPTYVLPDFVPVFCVDLGIHYREIGSGIVWSELGLFANDGRFHRCRGEYEYEDCNNPPVNSYSSASSLPGTPGALKEGDFGCRIRVEGSGTRQFTLFGHDYADNGANEAALTLNLDGDQPTVTVFTPGYGEYISSHSVLLTGHVNETVVMRINGIPVDVAPNGTFSAAVTLTEGVNNIEISATDRAGNLGIVDNGGPLGDFYVISDTIPPHQPIGEKIQIVSIDGIAQLEAEPGSVDAGSAVVVTNTDTGESATVTAGNDGSFAAIIVAGVGDHLTITSADLAHNVSPALTQPVPEPLYVRIEAPLAGSSVGLSGQTEFVTGVIYASTDTGVTVNGVPAAVIHADSIRGRFYAYIPIHSGTQQIVATAEAREGRTDTDAIAVNPGNPDTPFALLIEPFQGVVPFRARLTFENHFGNRIDEIKVDFDGDSSFDFATTDPEEPIEYEYSAPGLVTVSATVKSGGQQYELSGHVVALDAVSQDSVLQKLWAVFRQDLASGNNAGAVNLFSTGSQDLYGQLFQVLQPQMPAILASMTGIYPIEINYGEASYLVMTAVSGETNAFVATFVRGPDGLWRLESI